MIDLEICGERLSSELEKLLLSTHFSQSKRAQNFLRYIVSETIAGRGGELKERAIGAVVFHKALDYDTGNDSVVRVAANDVRKRIAQYYQDDGARCEWIIELPPGTYIPALTPRHSASAAVLQGPSLTEPLFSVSDQTPTRKKPSWQVSLQSDAKPERNVSPALTRFSPMLRWGLWGFVTVVLLATLGRSVYARRNPPLGPPAFDPVWQAFRSPDLTYFSVGSHDNLSLVSGPDKSRGSQPPTVTQLNTMLEAVPVSDVIAIASLADFMGRHEIPYRIVSTKEVSLARLRRHPTVLFGGLDNVWTLKLTKDLPFTFAVTRTNEQRIRQGIIQERTGAQRTWSLDFTGPSADWKKDYAIVSQFHSGDTEMPIVIIAGIGSAGTLSAMEFMTNPRYTLELQGAGVSPGKPNFQAVLSTNVIDGDSGPPHLEAISVW